MFKCSKMNKPLIFIVMILYCCMKYSEAKSSCDVSLNGCNYTLSVSPSNSCHGDHPSNRVKRSSSDKKIVIPPEHVPLVSILSKKIRKLQNKMSKEMTALSTRVLRGVRKIETLMAEDVAKQPLKRGIAQSTKLCPDGFLSFERWPECYMFSTFNTTWYEARDFCDAFNSDMVALGSLKEHYVVTFLIKNNIGKYILQKLAHASYKDFYKLCKN